MALKDTDDGKPEAEEPDVSLDMSQGRRQEDDRDARNGATSPMTS